MSSSLKIAMSSIIAAGLVCTNTAQTTAVKYSKNALKRFDGIPVLVKSDNKLPVKEIPFECWKNQFIKPDVLYEKEERIKHPKRLATIIPM